MKFDYYATPSQEIFDDIKSNAIEIWKTYDDTYGYQSEKVNRVNNITNFKDNCWGIVAMFDQSNQSKLFLMVRPETRNLLLQILQEI